MKTRLEFKVGLFVLVGLVLLAALLLQFSKGLTFFRPTYTIYLHAVDIAGLKKNAGVLMSGVQVGSATEIRLEPDGKSVVITLKILSRFQIHKDARFTIETSGFLGDQYVSIRPGTNEAPMFRDGEVAEAEKPFNFQDILGSSGGIIERLDSAVQKLDQALSNMNMSVLSPETLTNLSATMGNLRGLSERANVTVENLNGILMTNRPAVDLAVSNAVKFSQEVNVIATDISELLEKSSPGIQQSVKNVETSTEILKSVLEDVQKGKGVGALLKNDQISTNLSEITENLSITSSNLNRLGLWGILWKKRQPKTNDAPRELLQAPKDPFR